MDPELREYVEFFVKLAASIFGALAVVWRFLKKPLEEQLNGFGKRLNHTEQDVSRLSQDVGNLDRERDMQNLRELTAGERMGRMESTLARIEQRIGTTHDDRVKEDGRIVERLASIEGRFHVLDALNQTLRLLAQQRPPQ